MSKATVWTAIQVLIYFLLLYSVKIPFFWISGGFALALWFVPVEKKLATMSAAHLFHITFFSGIFVDTNFKFDRLRENFRAFGLGTNLFSTSVFRFFGAVAVALLIGHFFRRLKHSNPMLVFFKLLAVLFSFIGVMLALNGFNQIQILLWIVVTILAKYFWMILYSLRQNPEVESWSCRFLYFPFWSILTNYHIHNIPRGVQELKTRMGGARSESVKLGLKSLIVALVLALGSTVIWDLMFQGESWYRLSWFPKLALFEYPSIFEIGIRKFNQFHFSWYEVWLITLAHGLCFLLRNASRMFVLVSLIQLCGIHVDSPVHQIGNSRSFSDFVGRYYYYYSDYIKNFFYYPLLIRLDRYRLEAWQKKFIAAFVSVFVGGVLGHFIIEVGRAAEVDSIRNVLTYVLLFSPYLLLLGLFVGISSCLPRAVSKMASVNSVLVAVFAATYTICFSMQFYLSSYRLGLPVSSSDYWEFLRNLFGVG